MMVWASVVLNMTVVDSDRRFEYLCSSHLQTLKISLVVKMSATVNNSPIQDYTYPDDHIPPTGFHIIGCIISITLSIQKMFGFFLFLFLQLLRARGFKPVYDVDQYYEKNFILEFQ